MTIERLGAATTRLLTDWLTRHAQAGGRVIVRPVLDLADPRTSDAHDPPAWMRETARPARRDLRLPRLPARLPGLRPRPHRGLPAVGRRRTARPDVAGDSRAAVPHPPPPQDPHRVDLPAQRGWQLHLDRAHRPPLHRPGPRPPTPTPRPLTPPTTLTPRTPTTQPRSGPPARPQAWFRQAQPPCGCGRRSAHRVSTDRSLRLGSGQALRSLRQAQDKRCSTSAGEALRSLRQAQDKRCSTSSGQALRSLRQVQVKRR